MMRWRSLILIVLVLGSMPSCVFWNGYQRGYQKALTQGHEAYLVDDLRMMREGIKKYTNEKGTPPQSLEELDDKGYITYVPTDPVTDKVDWVVVFWDCSGVPNCKNGIKDVHSASKAKSSKGNLYSEW